MADKLATFKWFTDTYTRGTWENGISSTIFNTSRTNVSSTSNKLINYNDLYTPSVYNYDYDGEIGTITAVANQCVTQGQIDSLMRKNNYTLAFQKSTSGTALYIQMTDFETGPAIPPNSTIKIRIKINNTSVYDVDIHLNLPGYISGEVYTLNYSTVINHVSIIGVSVYRPNTSTSYIVKPRIYVNYTSNLNGAISIADQATLFSYIEAEIPNFVGGSSSGGGGTTGRVLNINSSWKTTDDAEDSGMSFELCWGYVDSKVDTNVYLITNPESGTGIYVEDDNKEMGDYIGKYIVFYGETIDLSVPLFLSYEVRDWGDTYSLS